LRGHERSVWQVAWSPSGERLASASWDGTVRVWDPTGLAEPLVLRGHEQNAIRVAWSPSGERLASASEDGTVRVWDPTGEAEPLVLRGHKGRVRHVAWSSSGGRLASASWDGTVRVWTVRVWDPQTGAQLDCYEGRAFPESFYQSSEKFPSYACRALSAETCIEHRHDESPVAWFEVSGRLVMSPRGAPMWAASSGPRVVLFTLEDAPD
jgi:WD40 repeat protein